MTFTRADGRNGRTYRFAPPTVPEPLIVPSVTTILGGGIPKPALPAWAARLVAETAVNERDHWARWHDEPAKAISWLKETPRRHTRAAATRGTQLHELAERIFAGEDPPAGNEPAEHLARWRDQWVDRPLGIEQTAVHVAHRWAGTIDLPFLDKQHTPWVVDLKTGKSAYPEHAIQVAAYACASHWHKDDAGLFPSPPIARVGILHLSDDGCTLYEPDRSIPDLYADFRAAQRIHESLTGTRLQATNAARPTLHEWHGHLVARCRHAQQYDGTFAARLADIWPHTLPTLKAGGLTLAQLEQAERLITDIENLLGVPFGPVAPWTNTPTKQRRNS